MSRAQLLILVVFIFFLISSSFVGAFGVSPPYINQSKLIPGSHYEEKIFLLQGQPKEDLEIVAEFDVPDKIRSWFSIDKGEQFVIPAGIQQYPIIVSIDVPQDAEFNIYKGFLRIRTVPAIIEGTVTVATGARIDLNLVVGEGVVVDYTIQRVDILDIKEGESPRIVVTLANTGNVSVAASRATFDLYDKYGEVRLGFAQNENLPEVQAFKTETFIVEFPLSIKLGLGEYWAEAKIYREGAVVGELRTVFNVIEKKISLIIWIVLFIALIILIGFTYKFIWLKRIR